MLLFPFLSLSFQLPLTTFYTYKITELLRVVDGDTIHLVLDLGWGITRTVRARLYGIDAPEMRTPEGLLAKEHLAQLLHDTPGELWAKSYKDKTDDFGRVLLSLYKGETDINASMVADGFAMPWP